MLVYNMTKSHDIALVTAFECNMECTIIWNIDIVFKSKLTRKFSMCTTTWCSCRSMTMIFELGWESHVGTIYKILWDYEVWISAMAHDWNTHTWIQGRVSCASWIPWIKGHGLNRCSLFNRVTTVGELKYNLSLGTVSDNWSHGLSRCLWPPLLPRCGGPNTTYYKLRNWNIWYIYQRGYLNV